MTGIRTAIELTDQMTAPLMSIINALNLTMHAFDGLQNASAGAVNTAEIEGAREEINQATTALIRMEEAAKAASHTKVAPEILPTTTNPSVPVPIDPIVPTPLIPPQEPVQIPVEWQSPDTVEVFTSSGVERYRQELASTNQMLNQVTQNQQKIGALSNQTDIFPDNMISDLRQMDVRIQKVRSSIEEITNNPIDDIGADAASAELERLRNQLSQAVQAQNDLNAAMQRMDVSAANTAYNRLNNVVDSTDIHIRDNLNAQNQFNQSIHQGQSAAEGLKGKIGAMIAVYASAQGIGKGLDLSDTMTQTTARLNMMNDGLQTTKDLQNMIFLSAERSRGAYQSTADAVSKLGLMAGDAFSSSSEIIAFSEQLNKQFTIAGTEAAGVEAAMLQLTQAMGSGVLRGEEYNSILEQAPNIIASIADYLDVPKGKLKELAGEGKITAEIVKNALFAAADETNAKFDSMPKTFSQVATSIANNALMAFRPVLDRLSEFANSEQFNNFVNGIINGLVVLAGVAMEVFDLIAQVGSFISDNWSIISPIIWGIVVAMGLYNAALIINNIVTGISNGIKAVHAAATMMSTGATFAATAAQHGFNAALLACPLTWIILAIIAVIAVIYAVIAAINQATGSTISATEIICGVIAMAGAFIANIFFAVINFVFDLFAVLWNFIAAFANFFANVFTDPIGAIARLFFDLVDTVLGLLQSLASAIDWIFGSNLAGAVGGWRDGLSGWVDSTFGKGVEVMEKISAEDWKIDRFDYGDAWEAGKKFGAGIDAFDPTESLKSNIPGEDDYANPTFEAAAPPDLSTDGDGKKVGAIKDNTDKIKDSVDISAEDLKYLRDVAEMEVINRFTTAEIKITQTNHNKIESNTDIDGINDRLNKGLQEAIDYAAEGVHA